MATESSTDYLTIGQAASVFRVSTAAVRRLLRAYGLGDFTRASMRRDVLISRRDLEHIFRTDPDTRKGAA